MAFFKTKKVNYIINGILMELEYNQLFEKSVLKDMDNKLRRGVIDGWYVKNGPYNCYLTDQNYWKYIILQKAA